MEKFLLLGYWRADLQGPVQSSFFNSNVLHSKIQSCGVVEPVTTGRELCKWSYDEPIIPPKGTVSLLEFP